MIDNQTTALTSIITLAYKPDLFCVIYYVFLDFYAKIQGTRVKESTVHKWTVFAYVLLSL